MKNSLSVILSRKLYSLLVLFCGIVGPLHSFTSHLPTHHKCCCPGMSWNGIERSLLTANWDSNQTEAVATHDIAFNIYFSECLSKQVQYNFRVQLNKVRLSWTVVHSVSTSSLLPILAVVSRTESGGPPFNWGGGAMRQSKSSCKRSFYAVTCYCWLGEFNLPVCWFVICC